MGKNTVVDKEKDVETINMAEPEDRSKEVIETLRVQLKEHSQRADHHRTMATKAQGALEVLLQLHPQEEKSDS